MELSAVEGYTTQCPGAPEPVATHDLIGINSINLLRFLEHLGYRVHLEPVAAPAA
jgi:hypothetical protein